MANHSELCTNLGEKQSFPAQFPTGQAVQINTGHAVDSLGKENSVCQVLFLFLVFFCGMGWLVVFSCLLCFVFFFGAFLFVLVWFYFYVLYDLHITNNGLCFYSSC